MTIFDDLKDEINEIAEYANKHNTNLSKISWSSEKSWNYYFSTDPEITLEWLNDEDLHPFLDFDFISYLSVVDRSIELFYKSMPLKQDLLKAIEHKQINMSTYDTRLNLVQLNFNA